jgi:hypothetical protein
MELNKKQLEIKYKVKKLMAIRYDAYYIYSKLLAMRNTKIKYKVIKSIQKKYYGQMLSGVHSGKIGDLIYALPTIKKLKIKHIKINISNFLHSSYLNMSEVNNLVPLLLEQNYIKKISIINTNLLSLENLNNSQIDVNYILDKYTRSHNFLTEHIIKSHAEVFNIRIDLKSKWLSVGKIKFNQKYKEDYILINFTDRYRSKKQEFWEDLLKDSPIDIIGIGLPHEFKNMNRITDKLITCKNFLEMAYLIKNSKLFIGNQSSAFAIAEGLKVNRILEQSKDVPNVYPLSENGLIINDLGKEEFRKIIKNI